MQADGSASKLGGIMEVAMWLYTPLLVGLWYSLGLVPNYVVLDLGNEGGGLHHIQGRHTQGLYIGLRKLVVLTLKIFIKYLIEAKNIISFFMPMFRTKANMSIYIFISTMYNLPSINVIPREWIKVNIYRGVNN
jgi:hypothetical protein